MTAILIDGVLDGDGGNAWRTGGLIWAKASLADVRDGHCALPGPVPVTWALHEQNAHDERKRRLLEHGIVPLNCFPALPAEVWNTRPINSERCMDAVRAMCGG